MGIFVDAEDVMKRWGNMKPRDFLNLVVFAPDRRSGLIAYQRDTQELAVVGDPENYDQIDFSNFSDEDNRIDPACLKHLSFDFCDVERYEQENPIVLRHAEWKESIETPNANTGTVVCNPIDQSHVETHKYHPQKRDEPHEGSLSEEDDREIKQLLELEDSDTLDSSEIDPEPTLDSNAGESLDGSGRKVLKLKEKAKQRCRAIAALIVSVRPELRPSQIAECLYMKDFGERLKIVDKNGNLLHHLEDAKLPNRKKTICEWISDLCPTKTGGRPTKEENLTEITIDITITKKTPEKS